ncbi:hypothetical protein [Desulfosarcina ovata]|uniref:Uncharacterized protein n=1 Tax=Desulfosarcina ovata subsp. ovata TaxID=2752305 RepID=A0A5K8ACR2_9BACT|nr:hypothetical protein [Desulfosarcina ovata]BBO89730.1 hypothetical protein DSCOOX_29100 [Desulfosarcina ovata subsp. ovata]
MQFNILNGWMRAVLSIESKQWIGLVFGNKLLPKIKADPLPYKAQDGQVRRRYTVQIQMVKRHLQICLQKYLPLINSNAKKVAKTYKLKFPLFESSPAG